MMDDQLNFCRARKILIALVVLFLPPVAVLAPHGLVVLFALTAVLAVPSKPVRRSTLTFLQQPLGFILGLFLMWMLCSTLWSPNPHHSLELWCSVAAIFVGGLLLLAAAKSLSLAEARIASIALGTSGILLLGLITVEISFDNILVRAARDLINYKGGEVTVNNINGATTLAAVLSTPILIAVHDHINKRFSYVLALAMLTILWFAPMEAAAIALLAALLSFVLAVAWTRPFLIILTTLFCSGVLVAPLLPPLLIDIVGKFFGLDTLPSAWLHRLYIWQFVANRVAEKPVFGWGFDSARAIPGNDKLLFEGAKTLPLHPHNGALQLWLELGGIGVLIFMPLVIFICSKLCQEKPDVAALGIATVVGWATFALVSFGAWHNWWLVVPWISTAMFVLTVRSRNTSNTLR